MWHWSVLYCTHQYRNDKSKYVTKQSEIKYCFQVLVTCIQVLASKLSTNAKFQNLQDLNSRTIQGFSSTFKHLICFRALSRALKFLFQIQAFSRISQACYEPRHANMYAYMERHPINIKPPSPSTGWTKANTNTTVRMGDKSIMMFCPVAAHPYCRFFCACPCWLDVSNSMGR